MGCKCRKIVKTAEVTTVYYDSGCYEKATKKAGDASASSCGKSSTVRGSILKCKKSFLLPQDSCKVVTSTCCKCQKNVDTFQVIAYEYDQECLDKLKQRMVDDEKNGCVQPRKCFQAPRPRRTPSRKPSSALFRNLFKCSNFKKKSAMSVNWTKSVECRRSKSSVRQCR